ncbi:TlpA disulfide reductase family protein [Microbacter margulisiae]|uniref:Glutathione peroxidase-family protein n=1 Tax=Microbacter margulisiae TaxID=1350067 RepID=A0A7W5DSZ0_9PORP|nr:TlpA disulfide reductase family protein [Microbacter margulisiae]MBB3188183.1 glutathione peroxidase-family protein [Microbacter margulisiae]
MHKTNTFLVFLSLIFVLAGCTSKKQFTVSGTIAGASGQKLYLVHDGLLSSSSLDSCVLDAKGNFSFKAARPKYPDFYLLKLNNESVLFAVDSCEHVVVDANAKTLDSIYTVEGSSNSEKINELHLSLLRLQKTIAQVLKTKTTTNQSQITAQLDSAIEQHKKIARAIILTNPLSTAAYYAVFQQLNEYFVFSPFNKDDRRYCAAVATAYSTFYPKYNRSISLYNYVMQAIVADRKAENQAILAQMLQHAKSGIVDLSLPDINGTIHKLSDLKGKVVLLDFVMYQEPNLSDYIFSLRDLYSKYHSQGLEVYQVSLDKNQSTWINAITNLPWICVWGNGNSALAYNVRQVPTNFLIDRSGNLVKRNASSEDIIKAIQSK